MQLLLAVGFIVFAGLVLGLFIWISDRTASEPEYYLKRIESSERTITQIANSLQQGETLTDPALLPSYINALDTIVDNCSDIIKRSKTASESFKAKASDTAKLCTDLLAVASYQKSLYNQLELIITYQANLLSDTQDSNFGNRLEVFNGSLTSVLNNMNRLDNNRVNDPGLDEIKVVLLDLQERSRLIMNNIAAAKANPTELNLLVKRTKEVQADLLIRRGNFWNSTIGIGNLQKALQKQADQYR